MAEEPVRLRSERQVQVQQTIESLIHLIAGYGDPRLARSPYADLVVALSRRAAARLCRIGSAGADALEAAATRIAGEAVEQGTRAEIETYLDDLLMTGAADQPVVEGVRRTVNRYWRDLIIDDPVQWVHTAVGDEARRQRTPGNFLDSVLAEQCAALLDLLHNDGQIQSHLASLTRGWVDPDDVRQEVTEAVLRRFRKADRLGQQGYLLVPGRERAYLRTAIRHEVLDLLGTHRQSDRVIVEGGEDDIPDPDDEFDERAALRVDLLDQADRIRARSFSAPSRLGPVYGEQCLAVRNGNSRHALALRFAVACLITAWQRRSLQLQALGLLEPVGDPPRSGELDWLRPAVNRALGEFVPGWSGAYRIRLPEARGTSAGVRGEQESSDYRFLLDVCQGRAIAGGPADDYGERSVRRHGVAVLMRVVYGDLVRRGDEGAGW